MSWKWQFVLFSLTHVLIFFVLFHSGLYDDRYSSTDMYFDFASNVMSGKMPYRDFPLEYPPLVMIFLVVPRLFAPHLPTYIITFRIEMLAIDIAAMYLISILARKLKLSHVGALHLYTAFLLANGPLTDERYDLVPAFMMLLALYTFYRGQHKTAWAILAVATMTKLYPAVIAPVFLISNLVNRRYQRVVAGSATFALAAALTAIPFFLMSPSGFISMFAFHAKRGIQFESTYSALLMLAHRFNLVPAKYELTYGSWNMAGAAADTLAKLSSPLLLLALALIYWSFYLKSKRNSMPAVAASPEQFGLIINYSVAAVIAFMIAGKVFSPQYILWLYPLIPLVTGQQKYFAWGVYLASGLMTLYIWPVHYTDFFGYELRIILILLGRNILFMVMAAVLLRRIRARDVPTTVPQEKTAYDSEAPV